MKHKTEKPYIIKKNKKFNFIRKLIYHQYLRTKKTAIIVLTKQNF